MVQDKPKRWHRDSKDAQFIVRQIINGNINFDKPKAEHFIKEFPAYQQYGKKNFTRNFKACVERWKSFVNNGQGELK